MENVVSTPAKWQDIFWDYTRSIHESIGHGLQEKDLVSIMDEGSAEDYFAERLMPDCDYITSNMGDADNLIPTEGQHVRLTHLLRCTSCWNEPMFHIFHTLRGCFMYSFVYPNDMFTREKAEKLVDKAFENLMAVTHMK